MALIAEFEADAPFAGGVMARVPEMTLTHEETSVGPDGGLQFVCWAAGDDFATFERGLEGDDDIAGFDVVTDLDHRRLYAVGIATEADDSVHTTMVERGIQFLSFEQDATGVVGRVRCPSREAYADLKRAWEERYGEFVTRSIYPERDDGERRLLTPKQRETLRLAFEEGYFEVPRRASLDDLAAELGVSDAAVSQRLRRGIATLVGETCPETGSVRATDD